MTSSFLKPRVAIIGSGVSGLGASLSLTEHGFDTTLFEASPQLGGHARTVEIEIDHIRFPVDTGFLVFNHRTYPHLLALFERLEVPTSPSDMSFAVSEGPHRLEWAGTNLRSVFAQPKNLFSVSFWRMLADILTFNKQATALAIKVGDDHDHAEWREPLSSFLERNRYSASFRDRYLLPMAAAIWSCPMKQMLEFPLGSFVRFFHNHGLLLIKNRPQWYTVTGGSREYVQRIQARLNDVRASTPVTSIARVSIDRRTHIEVTSKTGVERFDHIVLACHSDQALKLISDPTQAESDLLRGVRYQANEAWLHTDIGLMPKSRSAWAAWNYMSDGNRGAPNVALTYWLNKLQPLPCHSPVLLSLNPLRPPATTQVISRFDFEHPILDAESARSVRLLPQTQGKNNTWFAGAWLGFGFHEDGLRSGIEAASALINSITAEQNFNPVAIDDADTGSAPSQGAPGYRHAA